MDLVEIDRIREIIERRPRFVDRFFSQAEIEQAGEIALDSRRHQYFASRFAAKEAVIKSFGRPIRLQSIQTLRSEQGPPELTVNFQSRDLSRRFLVSLSHTKNFAVAQAVYLGGSEGDEES